MPAAHPDGTPQQTRDEEGEKRARRCERCGDSLFYDADWPHPRFICDHCRWTARRRMETEEILRRRGRR